MKQITIYNSLTHKKEQFVPLDEEMVTMYSCGPTVYDRVHVGNLRAFIMADTLQRIIRHVGGYDLRWVMNITDIDDKMIARSQEKYPGEEPAEGLKKLAQEYESKFLQDLEKVGVEVDDVMTFPHATDYIKKMQALITDLYEQEIAYVADGSVYFSLEAYAKKGGNYGQLAHIAELAKTRIDDQDQKQGAGDFALWKAYKPGEPSWDFELNGEKYPGRPGWHIECSAMSTDLLGPEFDIHTGGVDLKFPHHENEIAQCGGTLAHYWVHNEHLTVDKSKMAKSAGNFVKLDDVADPLALRLMMLSAHYRSQMDFSEDGLSAAHARLVKLREWASKLVNNPQSGTDGHVAKLVQDFDAALADDMNTPQAMAVLAAIENTAARSEDVYAFLLHADEILGLHIFELMERVRTIEGVDEILSKREDARKDKDYTHSDELRSQLNDLGVGVEDTPEGQIVWQLF